MMNSYENGILKQNSDINIKPGVDIIEISRIRELYKKWGDRFLNRVFTQAELSYCLHRADKFARLAGRFAGKEAVIKVLKNRISPPLKTIEIICGVNGEPIVNLTDEAKEMAREAGIVDISVSISHSREYAVAMVISVSSKSET